MKRCPECGADCEPGQPLCAECGARLVSGAVAPPAPPPLPENLRLSLRVLRRILEVFPGLALPKVLVPAAFTTCAILAQLWLARVSFRAAIWGGPAAALLVIPAVFLGGGAGLTYLCTLCWVICGEVCAPQDAVLEFQRKQWWAFGLSILIPLALVLALLKVIA